MLPTFIDSRLAEAWEEKDEDGLAERPGTGRSPLAGGAPAIIHEGVARTAPGGAHAHGAERGKPQKPEEQFFKELKSRVVDAYYTSEIGIKQEMEYKGNTYQTEFAGYDVTKEQWFYLPTRFATTDLARSRRGRGVVPSTSSPPRTTARR